MPFFSFRHNDLPNEELHCLNSRYVHCYIDGGAERHFDRPISTSQVSMASTDDTPPDEPRAQPPDQEGNNEELPAIVHQLVGCANLCSDNIRQMRKLWVML